MPSIDKMC